MGTRRRRDKEGILSERGRAARTRIACFFGQLNRSHGIAPWESLFGDARIAAPGLPGFHPTRESRCEGRRSSLLRFAFCSLFTWSSVCLVAWFLFFHFSDGFHGHVQIGEETSEARACSRENSTRARGKTTKARGACRTRTA